MESSILLSPVIEGRRDQYSWTDVFVKRGGEWKAVAAHVTPVAKK